MFNKKISYNKNKKNLLIVFPLHILTTHKDTLLNELIMRDIISIYKENRKEYNIILSSKLDDVRCEGFYDVLDDIEACFTNRSLDGIGKYYKSFTFDKVIISRYNICDINSTDFNLVSFPVVDKNEGSEYNLNILRSFVNLKLFMNIIYESKVQQIQYNDKDVDFQNSDLVLGNTHDIDYNKYSDTKTGFGEYMFYKYGIYNLPNVVYLKSGTINEFIHKIPLKKSYIPIEYTSIVDKLKDNQYKIGEFEYINTIFDVI